jgi:phage pi2 protein 07
MNIELLSITFSVPVYYTEQELDIIEEELKDTEDVVSVVCSSQTFLDQVADDDYIELKETMIVFWVKTDNYNHIIGRLKLAIDDVLKRITPEHDR